jgi:hypothetical protein
MGPQIQPGIGIPLLEGVDESPPLASASSHGPVLHSQPPQQARYKNFRAPAWVRSLGRHQRPPWRFAPHGEMGICVAKPTWRTSGCHRAPMCTRGSAWPAAESIATIHAKTATARRGISPEKGGSDRDRDRRRDARAGFACASRAHASPRNPRLFRAVDCQLAFQGCAVARSLNPARAGERSPLRAITLPRHLSRAFSRTSSHHGRCLIRVGGAILRARDSGGGCMTNSLSG